MRGSGTPSITALSQMRVSGIVSGMTNGRSFSAIHFAKSFAIALFCASMAAAGTASGLSSVFVRNGVVGASEYELANPACTMPRQVTNRLD
jgi:hypothetical protein